MVKRVWSKLKDKENSYYVADSYNNFRPITLRTKKYDTVKVANMLNDTKDLNDIMDFKGYRYCVMLADYKN